MLKKIFFVSLILISGCKSYSDIIAQSPKSDKLIQPILRYQINKVTVFGKSNKAGSINIQIKRANTLITNKNILVSSFGSFQYDIEPFQKNDEVCIETTECFKL